jgi:hypothetical protein
VKITDEPDGMLQRCAACWNVLRTVRFDAQFCSNACRQRDYRARRALEAEQQAKAQHLERLLADPAVASHWRSLVADEPGAAATTPAAETSTTGD